MHDQRRDTSKYLLDSWLGLQEAMKQQPELERILFDPVSGLPTTPLLFPHIREILEDRGEVTLLAVNVARYSRIEEIWGWQAFDVVMRDVAGVLDEILGEALRETDLIAELMISGNAFVVMLSPSRKAGLVDSATRREIAQRVEGALRARLEMRMEPSLFQQFGCYVGAATVVKDESARLERLVYEGLEAALADSREQQHSDFAERMATLRDIISAERISTLVHPVLHAETMEVIGYEALSRGPEGGEFERPDKLFSAAYDGDLVLRLERVCRKRALEAAANLPAGRLLFVNIEPEAVSDPQLQEIVKHSDSGIAADRIVFEITERTAIEDFDVFRSTLGAVRDLGFGIAIDDAGAGYGSLQRLAEIRPDWLKVDLSIVRGVDKDEVRAGLIESLVATAKRMGAKLIAEGVETEEELEKLRSLGVEYVQGFLLALPSAAFPNDDELPARGYAL